MAALKPDFADKFKAPKEVQSSEEGFQDPMEICFVVDLSQQTGATDTAFALNVGLKSIENKSQVRFPPFGSIAFS